MRAIRLIQTRGVRTASAVATTGRAGPTTHREPSATAPGRIRHATPRSRTPSQRRQRRRPHEMMPGFAWTATPDVSRPMATASSSTASTSSPTASASTTCSRLDRGLACIRAAHDRRPVGAAGRPKRLADLEPAPPYLGPREREGERSRRDRRPGHARTRRPGHVGTSSGRAGAAASPARPAPGSAAARHGVESSGTRAGRRAATTGRSSRSWPSTPTAVGAIRPPRSRRSSITTWQLPQDAVPGRARR